MLCRFFLMFLFFIGGDFVVAAPIPDWIRPLPEWARTHVISTLNEQPPAGDHDAWVVFERTEVSYGGENVVLTLN